MKTSIIKCFLLLLWVMPCFGHSQEKSMKFSKFSSDKEDVYFLIKKAEQVGAKDPKKALDYLDRALNQSINEKNLRGMAACYYALGKINYDQGLYSKAIEFYEKSYAQFASIRDESNMLKSRTAMGQAYEGLKQYDKALSLYQLSLQHAERLKQEGQVTDLKLRIGQINEKMGKLDKALEEYKQVLSSSRVKKDKKAIMSANDKIGDVYLKQDKPQAAESHYNASRELAIEAEDKGAVSKSVENLSKVHRKQKNYKEELNLRVQSAMSNTTQKDTVALSNDYREIGKIYLEQDAAGKAIPYLEKSAALAGKKADLESKVDLYKTLTEAYKKKGDYESALEAYKKYAVAKDSLFFLKERKLAFLVNFNEELNERQKKIDLLEKDRKLNEQTIRLLKEDQRFNKLVIYSLVVGLLLVFVSSWLLYNSSRKRRIANQVLALKSLRSQMNPHFIFNALNSVNNYISRNDERSANKYLSDFSRLMRTVMENSQHEFITLTTELHILGLYLSLEHERFKEKFDYELQVADDLPTDHIEIPPMFIQPHIENAIWHGLRYRDTKGFLKVALTREGTNLKVVVEDNGIGVKKSQELKTSNQKDKESTGLKNTESRMKIINELYGTRMRVVIESPYLADQTGTRVSIYIASIK